MQAPLQPDQQLPKDRQGRLLTQWTREAEHHLTSTHHTCRCAHSGSMHAFPALGPTEWRMVEDLLKGLGTAQHWPHTLQLSVAPGIREGRPPTLPSSPPRAHPTHPHSTCAGWELSLTSNQELSGDFPMRSEPREGVLRTRTPGLRTRVPAPCEPLSPPSAVYGAAPLWATWGGTHSQQLWWKSLEAKGRGTAGRLPPQS